VKSQAVKSMYKEVKSILISQPQPQVKSPYHDLEQKYSLKVDFREFTQVEPCFAKDVRKQKIKPEEFSSVILNSKTAIDHFFRVIEEMRIKINPETKYFCLTEAVANYLQNFILYRKRKVFVGEKKIEDLKAYFNKHKDKETFLLPCSNLGAKDITSYLADNKIQFQEVIMYETKSSDLSDLSDITYDVLVFFTPQAIVSLFENFPDFQQKDTRIAVFGNSTAQAVLDKGLKIDIQVPMPDMPSMPMALDKYVQMCNNSK
jgi:uroporphyrinogen-III synthase